MSHEVTFGIDMILRLKKTDKTKGTIYARVTVCKKNTEISLHEKVLAADWDNAREQVRGNTLAAKALNTHIENVRFKIREKFRMLTEKEMEVSAEAVKAAYLGTHKTQFKGHKLMELLEYHAKISPGTLAQGTLKNYVTTELYVRNFIKSKFGVEDVYLQSLNYEFITDLEHFIRNNPVKKTDPCLGNGVMKHLERFKKMVHWSRRLGWITVDPFEDYKLSLKRYKRQKLDFSELEKIEKAAFATEKLQFVQDLFLFSCYTGLAYADVMALKPTHFEWGINGKVMMKIYREKSDELSSVPVFKRAAELAQKYKDNPAAVRRGHVFPFLSNQEVNRHLKIISEICGIQKYMSFHLARHTFATLITLKNGVPIETVSKMLGHRKITTTEIYAVVDDEKIQEEMEYAENRLAARRDRDLNGK